MISAVLAVLKAHLFVIRPGAGHVSEAFEASSSFQAPACEVALQKPCLLRLLALRPDSTAPALLDSVPSDSTLRRNAAYDSYDVSLGSPEASRPRACLVAEHCSPLPAPEMLLEIGAQLADNGPTSSDSSAVDIGHGGARPLV